MTREDAGCLVRRWRACAARVPAALLVGLATLAAPPLDAQSVLERTPNTAGTWTLPRWSPLFVFTHRFEFINGGDELVNVPTLQLALGLPVPGTFGLSAGVDFSSNGESVERRVGGNETQWWLRLALPGLGAVQPALTGAYNTNARSVDGAFAVRAPLGRLTLIVEGRAFSDRFGSGDAGGAAAVGASLNLTRYLAVQGDVASAFTDDVGEAWSAGLAVAIPGTPHTFSLHATNAGATTLQGASREKVLGPRDVRYGFVFTVPFGGAERWRRVIAGDPPSVAAAADASAADTTVMRVRMRDLAFAPAELRVRAGTTVEWTNHDPVVHTVTANDGSWTSGFLRPEARWSRRFDTPGRYEYHCEPHPQMRGVVVVE